MRIFHFQQPKIEKFDNNFDYQTNLCVCVRVPVRVRIILTLVLVYYLLKQILFNF